MLLSASFLCFSFGKLSLKFCIKQLLHGDKGLFFKQENYNLQSHALRSIDYVRFKKLRFYDTEITKYVFCFDIHVFIFCRTEIGFHR